MDVIILSGKLNPLTMKKVLLILVTVLLNVSQSHAIVFKGHLLFTSKLDGSQVVPSVSSNANGVASMILNSNRDAITINLSFIGLSGPVINVSLFSGSAGTNGSSLTDLTSFLVGNKLNTTLSVTSITGIITKLMSGQVYLLVTTANNPAGEIRGQVILESDWNFVADLNSMETVPMMMSNAFGLGSFGLSLDKQKLNFKIVCQKLDGPITGAELRFGETGVTGNLAADISSYVTGINTNVISGSISTNAQMLDSLFSGKVYLNISTSGTPSGAVRSQLITRNGLSFDANPTGAQMVPPLVNVAQGVCVLRLSTNLDTLYFDAVADSLSTSLNYAHMHIGNFGAPYGAVQLDFTPFISGRRVKGKIAGLSNGTTAYKLLVSNLAFVFHTVSKPNGEIRGQIIRYAREGYTIKMQGEQLSSPVSTQAYGAGIVSTNRFDDNAHYLWNAGSLSSPATGAHFHKNKKELDGPEIYDMTGIMMKSGNDVSAEGFWYSSDSLPFLPHNSLQLSKDSIYLDIHNATFPDGEIRGQVAMNYSVTPASTVSTVGLFENINQVSVVIGPNPTPKEITVNSFDHPFNSIEVLSIYGQLIYAERNNRTGVVTTTVDLSGYPKGIYFIRVIGSDFSAMKKIIKE